MAYTASLAADEKAGAKQKWRRFKVDLWLTDLNTAEIGILKHTQHEAKSDQFSRDMEIIGQIKEDGERTGLIGYRKDAWKNEEGMKRRLVIKLFSDSMNWRGSMDMLMGRSLQLSVGARGVPVCAYSVNIARHEQLVQVERSAMKWPLFPERFSFFIDTSEGPRFYRLRRKVIAIGADYILYDDRGRKIGELDHRIINLGGSWKVKLAADRTYSKLETVLQLFCTMLRFNREARGHVARQLEQVHRGRAVRQLDTHERDLYMTPRRAR